MCNFISGLCRRCPVPASWLHPFHRSSANPWVHRASCISRSEPKVGHSRKNNILIQLLIHVIPRDKQRYTSHFRDKQRYTSHFQKKVLKTVDMPRKLPQLNFWPGDVSICAKEFKLWWTISKTFCPYRYMSKSRKSARLECAHVLKGWICEKSLVIVHINSTDILEFK